MTTAPEQTPETPPVDPPAPKNDPEPETGKDRLPDDHPAALALKNANKEAETLRLKLKEYEDRDLSEQQKLERRTAEAEERATKAETDLLRARIALEKGLPPKLAARLQGNTVEEMSADADDLLATLGDHKPPPPSFDGGPRTPPPNGEGDMNHAIRRALGRS